VGASKVKGSSAHPLPEGSGLKKKRKKADRFESGMYGGEVIGRIWVRLAREDSAHHHTPAPVLKYDVSISHDAAA